MGQTALDTFLVHVLAEKALQGHVHAKLCRVGILDLDHPSFVKKLVLAKLALRLLLLHELRQSFGRLHNQFVREFQIVVAILFRLALVFHTVIVIAVVIISFGFLLRLLLRLLRLLLLLLLLRLRLVVFIIIIALFFLLLFLLLLFLLLLVFLLRVAVRVRIVVVILVLLLVRIVIFLFL